MPRKLTISKSDAKNKKYKAVFTEPDGSTITRHFGHSDYEDYTQHKDKKRRTNYRSRHENVGNKNDPTTPASLSYYILWGDSTSLTKNIFNFKKKFNLK
jgi:hypothetical protein